jgi:hypothetical protein
MDFPSRDEARQHIGLQSQGGASAVAEKAPTSGVPAPPPTATASAVARKTPASGVPAPSPPAAVALLDESASPTEGVRFRVEKPGFETDVFDRRGIRNLIRTREILETDPIRVDDAEAVPAARLRYLRSLFSLGKAQKTQPPPCCRTHTDKVAFFRCHDSGRPLCEECSPDKKFGGSTIRVCLHCGGTADETPTA